MLVTDILSFLDYYAKIRERTLKLIAMVPQNQLEWRYQPHKFSIGDLIRHIAAIERNLYAEVVRGRRSCYSGCGVELAAGYERVLEYFNQCHNESVEIISNLDNACLPSKCEMPGGAKISVASALRLLCEHEIHHRGQLYVYLGMLGIKTAPVFGLSSEQVIAYSSNDY